LTEAGECRSRRLGASWRLTVLLMDIAFLPFAASVLAWPPIRGEIAKAKGRRGGGGT